MNFQEVTDTASDFAEEIIDDLTGREKALIREFYEEKKFRPDSIDDRGIFHRKLPDDPAIAWAMKNL